MENERKAKKIKNKKSREDPVNSKETYGHPRPAPWPGALLRWAAAPAANPQSWTCLDATRHVDSLRQDRKKVFSCSATLQSYTGVWGRVRLSVHSPPDPSRKLPTAYTHFPPGFLYQRLKNWEVLETGPTGDAPSLTSCCRSRLGKTENGPLLQKKKKKKDTWEKDEKKRLKLTVEGLEFGRIGRGLSKKETWSRRTSEGLRRISSSNNVCVIQILFLVLVCSPEKNCHFSWNVDHRAAFSIQVFRPTHTSIFTCSSFSLFSVCSVWLNFMVTLSTVLAFQRFDFFFFL